MIEDSSAPLFSIIVPVYNVEAYIEPALRSLMEQSFENVEFILVNDGSTDGSCAIIETLLPQDKRFVFLEQENRGYGAAMNLGLDHASGSYIGILEPDDFYTRNCLNLVAGIIQHFPVDPPDIIKGNFTLFYEVGEREKPYSLRSSCFDRVCTLKDNPDLIINNPSIWSAFYRREFLEKKKIRFKETPGASFQDLPFFWQSLGRAESIYVCRDILYRYRQDNPGSSINKKLDYRRILNIYRELLPEIEMNGWTFAKIAEDLYWNYRRIAREDRRVYRKEAAALLALEKRDLSKIDSRKVKWFMRRVRCNNR